MKRASLIAILIVFFIAATVRADTITLMSPNSKTVLSTLIIPEGSTVMSQTFVPPGTSYTGYWKIDFSFQNGFGTTWGDDNDGNSGSITFSRPVANLVIDWQTSCTFNAAALNGKQVLGVFYSNTTYLNCTSQGTTPFEASDIGTLNWVAYGRYGGVSSMSYNVSSSFAAIAAPYSIPETSSFLLTCMSLLGLVIFGKRKRDLYDN